MTTLPSRPGPSEPVTNSVIGTSVGGDLIQIGLVAGNVIFTQAGPGRPEQVVEGDIPAQPPGFQLREQLLQDLHEQVGAAGAAVVSAVTGTPGVGKTMLAASYAWACQAADWPVVAWISAETPEQIVTGLAGLAQRLGLRDADDDAATAARKAKAWLSARSTDGLPGLVVFDNAAQVTHVAAWCPATGSVRVLITSRNREFRQRYTAVEVAVFTPEQAIALLVGQTGLNDPAGARDLAHDLGHLPLALGQAAALIARRGLTFAAYRRLLAAFPLTDHLRPSALSAYPVGTAQAILLSVEHAERTVEGAGALLRVLAVLSPAGVPRVLLNGGADPADPSLPVADLAAAAAVQEVLAALADTSLIGFSEDGSTVVMHRLVQRVARDRADRDGDMPAAIDEAITLLETWNARIPHGAQTWAARAAVETLLEQTDTLHALTAASAIPLRLLTLRNWCAMYLTDLADLARAIRLHEQTLTDSTRVLGTDHPDTLASRNNLASAYHAAGNLTRAIPLYKQTLTEREHVLGTDHPSTLTSRNNLASAYHAAGNLTRAIPLYKQTLTEREHVLGTDHPDTLASRNNLASAYHAAGNLRRAIPLYEQTLTDSTRVLGTDHPDTLASRNNLASAYHAAGNLTRAIHLHEQALTEREHVLGTDHPDTLASRNNLAHAYRAAGDLTRAIPLYKQTLTEREHVLGTDHPDTLTSRNNLANAYRAAGNLTRAIHLHEQALTDCKRVLGDAHPITKTVQGNLNAARGRASRKE
ncbi:tetratricopeptide repeat protein [Rhizohabitans arisaemae]|uniref:tetratricopeptide repeat protein n=1 Tax=Rhizohabitans arisaemae TaxID=2720610 RepID=UPI0024B2855A|nr:tetratricopeptide repeat protein [Rhizohabitans arisaemae]